MHAQAKLCEEGERKLEAEALHRQREAELKQEKKNYDAAIRSLQTKLGKAQSQVTR